MLESLERFTNINEVNVNRDERWVSLAVGAVLMLYAMIRIPFSAVLAVAAAAYLFFRGMRGFCYFYDRLGMNKAEAIENSATPMMENNHRKRQTAVPIQ